MKRYIGKVLITVGILVILSAFCMKAYAEYSRLAFIRQYEQYLVERAEQTPDRKNDGKQDAERIEEAIDSEEHPEETDTAQVQIIGILRIPSIEVETALAEGISTGDLRTAVGHFPGTALPGEGGNCCVAGHRNYSYGEYFNRLDEVQIGDEIQVEYDGWKFTYEVDEILVVKPEETWVLDDKGKAEITLVTCTPIRLATHRLIVKGSLK